MKSSVSTKPLEGELDTQISELRAYRRVGAGRKFPQAHEVLDIGLQIIERLTSEGQPLTMADIYLGFGVSQSVYHYYAVGERGEEYVEPLDMLKTFVLRDKNRKLLTGQYSTAGAIFDLKNNHGWRDQTEQLVTLRAKISAEPMSEDEWLEKYGHRLAAPGRSAEIPD